MQQWDEALHVETLRLRDDIFNESIQEICSILHIHIHVREKLAQPIKDLVEILEDVTSRHLRDIIKRLTGIVSDARFGVVEAVQHGGKQRVEI